MTAEGGDRKVLHNFLRLIAWISAEPNYQPSNPVLAKAALEARLAAAEVAVQEILNRMPFYKAAMTERAEAFDALLPLARRVRDEAKRSGAGSESIATLEKLIRGLRGGRRTERVRDVGGTSANVAGKHHLALQLSFENRLANFKYFIAIVRAIETYKPTDPNLKVSALRALADELAEKNKAVNSAFVPLGQARAVRDHLLYQDSECVVNTALLVKAYVKKALGAESSTYRQIKGLHFERKPPR
jgi:hypothetical protein